MGCDDLVEGVFSGMGSDEGDVVGGMPVSGSGFDGKREGEKGVDLRDDVTALGDGKRPSLES